jgi:hypothetical protein
MTTNSNDQMRINTYSGTNYRAKTYAYARMNGLAEILDGTLTIATINTETDAQEKIKKLADYSTKEAVLSYYIGLKSSVGLLLVFLLSFLSQFNSILLLLLPSLRFAFPHTCITIYVNSHLVELPSSSGLQLLTLSSCRSLQKLGNYPNLKTLKINECSRLRNVGNVESLHNLLVTVPVSNPKPPLDQVLSLFPLEQLRKLWLSTVTDNFFALSSRFHHLAYLRVFQPYRSRMAFPGKLFPLLVELQTTRFHAVHLAGMTRLRHLQINRTPNNQIFGIEEIYPQLKSFSYSHFSELFVNEDSFLPLLKNVSCLSLQLWKNSLKPDFLNSVNRKVNSLDVYMQEKKIINPNRFFEMVKLRYCHLSGDSSFSNTQILVLRNCSLITDISSCKDAPFLHLIKLERCIPWTVL